MSESAAAPEFELPNAGPGPDPCSLAALARDHEFAVLYFQRNRDCPHSRKQVKQVARRRESFAARDVRPVAILPDEREAAERWQNDFDLLYPLLADADASVADDYGQNVRFGFVGDVTPYFGRLPRVVVVDLRPTNPELVWTHSGGTADDRPSSREVLAAVDDARE
jgi:peroxiredoxin Q/BCP